MRQTRSELRAELLSQDPRCTYCRRELDERSATVDHVIPKSRGGANCRDNLTLSCKHCNTFKAAKTPEEMLTIVRSLIRMQAERQKALRSAEIRTKKDHEKIENF